MNMTEQDYINKIKETLQRLHGGEQSVIEKMLAKSFTGCCLDEKRIDFSVKIIPDMVNILGTAHGCIICGLLDEAIASTCDVYFLDPDKIVTTIDMQFNCLKALHAGDEIIIKAYALHGGKRTATGRAELWRGDELCALATECCAVIDRNKTINK